MFQANSQINVGGTSTFDIGNDVNIKGGVFNTDKALELGLNKYVSKGGITTQDIENTTSYEGDAISVGLSVGKTTGKPQATMNGLGYGTDGDSDSSTTKAGITGIAGNSGITTDNRAEYAGALVNAFDAERVNEELGAQTQMTQAFDQERRKIKTQLNEDEKSYRDAAKEALENGDRESWEAYSQEADKIQQKSLLFDGISGAIYGPNTNGAVGYVAKAISPQVAFQIGQAFKDNDFENYINGDNELSGVGSSQHLLAHALLGAAVSVATGNDALAGGLGASAGEGTALVLSKYIYKVDNPSELTAEQKDTISSIASLTGVALGATTGDVTDAVNAGETALVAVQDNGLENVLLPHEIDEIKNNPNYSREQLEAFQRMPEMIGDLDIVYKKNNKGNFIVCVPYSGNSCAPRSNERYATPDEIKQGTQDFALNVVPIPGSKGAAIVVKKTGEVIGKYKDARAAKKAADEAVQKARVTNNNQIDDDLGNKPLGGEHRANQYSYKWQGASLRNVREKFAGENPIITQTSKGKIIHENRETGIQVVYDKGGDYFRIYDKSLKGRKYLDLNGKVLNNKTLPNGKQTGMSKSEYNEATHFKVDR